MKYSQPQKDSCRAQEYARPFAGLIPAVDRWVKRRDALKALSDDAGRLERKAEEWEKRGHWQLAGRFKELAAKRMDSILDVELRRGHMDRREALLRGAIIDYALEIGDAARYDPAIQFRMYMVARRLGEPAVAKSNLDKAMHGFGEMFTDRNLEALVRLNRLKRDFIYQLWEGESADAFKTANEALNVAREIKTTNGITNRWKDTSDWLDARIDERYGSMAAGAKG